ncbi:hypothetical protein HY636_03415 [Candidatus Woesearchaeota archaeon]|nr:hypothetical protein [Candidatus Woesearchaeota archaeon]
MQYVQKEDPETQKERQRREEMLKLENEKEERSKRNRKIVIISVSIIAVLLISTWITYYFLTPGKYDDFAKCLAEKGAVMYGEDWCQYTNAQKAMFGKSFKYINYQVKTGLNKRPTWVIDGKTYETVQSFQRLSELTGCKY